MEKYKVNKVEDITPELVKKLIDKYIAEEVPRLERLVRYYLAQGDIKDRQMKDKSKPNNKYANSYGSFITDTMQGYFLGKPIGYTSDDKDFVDRISTIYNEVHEHAHNADIGKSMSIKGIAYELLFMNGSDVDMAEISANECFLIYDTTVNQNVLAGVRFYYEEDYLTEESILKVEVYTDEEIIHYTGVSEGLREEGRDSHNFKAVPIIKYANNKEETGDYEKVIDLINAYDLAVSDTANNLEYFADAYLVLKGVDLESDDDDSGDGLDNMKEKRVLLLDKEGTADWLTKGTSDLEVESYKDRLKEDIHLFSHVPSISGADFGSATSGESLKYKLVTLENIISIKERYFRHALENRLDLITTILNIKGGNYDSDDMVITFNRNLPTNFAQLIDGLSKIEPFISRTTLLSQIPFVSDVEKEMQRLAKEETSGMYTSVLSEEE